MRFIKGDVKFVAATGKSMTFTKQNRMHTWCRVGCGHTITFPVISFRRVSREHNKPRRLFPNGMLHKQYVQTMTKVFGCGIVSVIKLKHFMEQVQALVANQMSVCGKRQLHQRRHLPNVSANGYCRKVSWIKIRSKFAVAVDLAVFLSRCTACFSLSLR